MSGARKKSREPKSELHEQLGNELRLLREARGLTQRRLAQLVGLNSGGHVSNIEGGHEAPSQESLAKWVQVCGGQIGPLYMMLQQIHEAVETKKQAQRAANKPAPLVTAQDFYEPPDPGALYYIVTSDMRFTLDERGFGKESRVALSIRAKVPGVDRFFTAWGYNGSTERGVVRPTSGFGCSVGEFSETDEGVIQGYFKLDRILDPSDPQPYEFSFRMVFNPTTRAVPPSTAQFRSDTQRHSVAIQFTPPALPVEVWWFDVATAVEVELDPPPERVFPDDPGGYYYKEFVRPRVGRLYGIDYRWE